MSTRPISVEIYTTSHRILGRLSPPPMGMFSFLNIPTKSYIEVHGGHLNRLQQPGVLVERHAAVWFVKREIVAVLLSGRGEVGPTVVTKRGYTSPVSTRVRVMCGGYELRGSVETSGKFDFGSLLFEGVNPFIPLYDAQLEAILFPTVHAEAPALLFNREKVDAIAQLHRSTPVSETQTGELGQA